MNSSASNHPNTTILKAGQLVCEDRYRIVKRLADGSFGTVYKATIHPENVETVAIKLISKELYEKHSSAIDSEIAMLERISGKHQSFLRHIETFVEARKIATLFDWREASKKGDHYIVTEFCAKGDLFIETLCLVDSPYSGNAKLVKDVFLPILDAVRYLHDLGIYHCDIKPENVFRRADGSIALGDFGFATDVDVSERKNVGTYAYMSPELFKSLSFEPMVSARDADIWALGVLLFNMVACEHPWERACFTDKDFESYWNGPENYFIKRFELTPEADDLFRIFFNKERTTGTNNAKDKLLELRESISKLEDFGTGAQKVTGSEISLAGPESCSNSEPNSSGPMTPKTPPADVPHTFGIKIDDTPSEPQMEPLVLNS